jgi:type I restriction-modification system DNA methylase subunit
MGRQAYNEFKSAFEKMIHSKSTHQVFDEFLDFGMMLFKANRTEEQNIKLKEQLPEFLPLFEKYGEACEMASSEEEPLGEVFMEYLSYGKNGQFFTPMSICVMMQQLTMDQDDQEEKRLCDPACGSGRTLIAAGLQNRNLWLYGSDIDHRCVKMTALNMLIHTMRGEVAHMDTLSMKHWHSYHIHRVNMGGTFISTWTESGPGETAFIERLQKAKEKEQINEPVLVANQEPAPIQHKQGQLILF